MQTNLCGAGLEEEKWNVNDCKIDEAGKREGQE